MAAFGGAEMTVDDLKGKRVATSFEGLPDDYLAERSIDARAILVTDIYACRL